MLDCSTRLTVVAFLGALVALPAVSDADGKVSRGTFTSKGAMSQPFGNRSGGGIQERHAPRVADRGGDRDRYSDRGHDRDHDRDRYHDHDDHGHDGDRYHGHKDCDHDHHNHYYGYRYGGFYPPAFFFGFGAPAFYPAYVGAGPVGYWCEHCHFHSSSLVIFYDHVHLAHGVAVAAIPGLLVWNPVSYLFVFD